MELAFEPQQDYMNFHYYVRILEDDNNDLCMICLTEEQLEHK